MLTEEQIQWLVPVFNTAYIILERIHDFSPAYAYLKGYRVSADYFRAPPLEYEYHYDKDKGLFSVSYLDHGSMHYEVFGKTNKTIIQHILDELIISEAHTFYANRKIEEEYAKKPVDTNTDDTERILFFKFADERLEYCYSITDPFVDKIEESFCPPNFIDSENESVNPIIEYDYISIMPVYNKFFATIFFPNVRRYSSCKLILYNKDREEIQSFSIHKPHAEFDVTPFVKETCVYSLVADDVVIETHHY